jgi:cbb3-type cytochrome c oxidase subunit III
VLLAVAVAAACSGCGTGGQVAQGDQGVGAKVFQAKCASCHTLKAAGARGTVGPNLDDAFGADREQGYTEDTIRQVVGGQVKYPNPPMPPPSVLFPPCKGKNKPNGCTNDRTGDIAAVAAYVAASAGNPNARPAGAQAAGGGGGTSGKGIFSANCASCHTLAAAGATGTVGPNLDQLKPSFARARAQVTHGGAVMPAFKGQLTPAQISAVAKFVATSAGK